MVRAPAHFPALKALPRSSGFALLKPAEKPQLDPARILTMSGTIAVNLLALGMLMLPLSMPTKLFTRVKISISVIGFRIAHAMPR